MQLSDSLFLSDLPDTERLAMNMSEWLECGDVVLLRGDLGSGKTTLARFLIKALSKKEQEVPSPTFTLVQTFDSQKGPVWHFDLYRLKSEEEVWELGIEEAFSEGISIIEWPELVEKLLPKNVLIVELHMEKDGRRKVVMEGRGRFKESG